MTTRRKERNPGVLGLVAMMVGAGGACGLTLMAPTAFQALTGMDLIASAEAAREQVTGQARDGALPQWNGDGELAAPTSATTTSAGSTTPTSATSSEQPTSSSAPPPSSSSAEQPPPATGPSSPPPAPTTTVAKPPPTTPPPAENPAASPAMRVVQLVNQERARAGCRSLRVDERLVTAAQRHATDMANRGYFSHTAPEGTSFVDRARSAGYPAPGGENIAKGQRTAEKVMESWMGSSGHRANILNCSFVAIGVGHEARGPHWVQVFGR
ncbi:CAP domain-containing protein [Crossiella sp. NPDC003009]